MIKIFAFFGFFFSLILFLRVVKADTAPLEVQTQGENLKDELFEQYKQSLAQGKLKTKLEYNKIIEYFTTLSNQDDAEAQFELAKIYIAGKVGIKDTKKALELFNKSAENGNADALYELSKIYGAGKGVIRNAKKALEFLNKSAEKGNTVALYEVSKLYETGKGVTKDKEKAFEFLNKSAEKGNVDALYKLGVFYKTKGITKDLDKALDYLTKAVELGHKKAQLELDNIATEFKNEFSQQHELVYKGNTQAAFNVANFYAEGKGVEQSDDRAEFYYKKAADANHLEAFGKFYEFNDKIYISKYYKRLASYKELESNNKLATKGSYAALYSLGVYYMEEEQDEKKALEYFKMASKKVKKKFPEYDVLYSKAFFYDKKLADEGDVDAQCRVGFYYYSPTPSPYFYKQSFKYFKKAADKGNTQAQLKVASFYEEGWGAVDQDIDKALEYAKMASNVTYYNSLLLLKKNSVYKESFEVDKKLAEKGDVDALYRVGYCYLNYFLNMKYFNDIRKYDVSIKYLEKAAEKGHIEATYNLAKAHREKYRSISSPLALSYAKKAADKGHAGAMFLLGEYYKNRGINELNGDYHKIAYEYFEKAADLGDLDATKALLFISKYKQDKPDKAFKYYKILADLGDTLAQYEVGMFYTENSYKDYNEAFRYLKMSADKGNTKAQRKVAWMYEFGHGVEKDHAKAFEYYKKTGQISNYVLLTLCAKGEINDDASLEYCKKVFFDFKNDYMHSHINYPSLPYRLAMCYIHGVGVAKDYNKALEYLDEANALAYPDTYTPAQHAKTPLSKLHKELKINFLEKKDLAEKGNADAQYEVAILYEYGRGVDLDFDKAVEYYEKAMENGNLDAIYALAKLYEEKKQEYPKAVEYYEKAMENGNLDAIYALAKLYEEKKQEYLKAFEYYEKAMENGNLDAIYQVSRFYAEGKGIQKNEQKAVECYEKLADSGNMSVLYKLGDYYSEGRIVPKDEDKAFECYRKYILYYRKISKNNMNYDAVYRTAYCDIEGKGVKKDELYTIHAYGKIEHIAKSGYLQAIKLLEIDIKKQNNYRDEVSEFREKVSELTREEIKKRFIKNKEKYSLFYSQQ